MKLQEKENLAELRIGPLLSAVFECASVSKEVGRHVKSLDYHPPSGASVAIVLKRDFDFDFVKTISDSEFVMSATRTGRFLNVVFDRRIRELYSAPAFSAPHQARRIIVEHTSLVPVYPINISTFRLTVHGEWMRRTHLYLGDSVNSRFWVQESARQVDLVQDQFRMGKFVSSKTGFGKGDHTIGRIFTEAIMVEDGASKRRAQSMAARMFPLGASGIRRPKFANWIVDVISGWRNTLATAGIHIDNFDRDSDISKHCDYPQILHDAKKLERDAFPLSNSTLSLNDLTYLDWSILYYCFLLAQSDRVVSVVSNRQRAIQEAARDYACHVSKRSLDDLRVISVGDVYCDGKLDSVRNGRFHLVDELGNYQSRNIHSLTTRFLTARPSTNLNISLPVTERGRLSKSMIGDGTDQIVRACMLLDSLPLIAENATVDGDFAPMHTWVGHAKLCLASLGLEAPELARDLATRCDTFDPLPS